MNWAQPIHLLQSARGTQFRRTFSRGQNVNPIIAKIAEYTIAHTLKLRRSFVVRNDEGKDEDEIKHVVQALASREQYPSHGSVIDADEAVRLGCQ